jgi:hypothetical protein
MSHLILVVKCIYISEIYYIHRRLMWHPWGRGEVFTGFWLGDPKVRDHREDLGVGERITLSWTLGR